MTRTPRWREASASTALDEAGGVGGGFGRQRRCREVGAPEEFQTITKSRKLALLKSKIDGRGQIKSHLPEPISGPFAGALGCSDTARICFCLATPILADDLAFQAATFGIEGHRHFRPLAECSRARQLKAIGSTPRALVSAGRRRSIAIFVSAISIRPTTARMMSSFMAQFTSSVVTSDGPTGRQDGSWLRGYVHSGLR